MIKQRTSGHVLSDTSLSSDAFRKLQNVTKMTSVLRQRRHLKLRQLCFKLTGKCYKVDKAAEAAKGEKAVEVERRES